jgi:hypothetical protein
MRDLIVIGYPDEVTAENAADEARNLARRASRGPPPG